jgi:hypothetical protein
MMAKGETRTRYYMLLVAGACVAMALMLAFSEALRERALLFVPIFFGGAIYAIYRISGDVPVVARRVKESYCPLTRSQLMFSRLSKERKYGSLLQIAYISYFLQVQSATGEDVTKTWPVSDRALISRGIDPDFVRRARDDYVTLQKGHVTVPLDEYRAKLDEIISHLKVIEGSRSITRHTGGSKDGRKG